MADIQRLLAETLTKLDSQSTLELYTVENWLEPIINTSKESGETIDELQFELTALYLTLYDEPDVWGTRYGPEISSITADGKRIDTPRLESITQGCIDYWVTRMYSAQHPALRARYADLVWDLSQKATDNKPPIDAAHIAIDGYADALIAYPEMSFDSWGNIQKRIVDLALSINDNDRIQKAVMANVTYAGTEVDEDESEFRRHFLFTILSRIPDKRRPQAEYQAVIADFRNRLDTLNAAEADHFSMDRYALPLAEYYWSSQEPNEAKTVMRMYGAAVERMAQKTTMAILAIGWLNQLEILYRRFEMNEDAIKIIKLIEKLQPQVMKDLRPISTSHQVSKEEIDEFLNLLVTDDVDESFANVTVHFVPVLNDLCRQLEDLKKDFPFSQRLSTTLVGHEGRTIAEIAPNDTEDMLIQQTHQDILFHNPLLELVLNHMFEKHSIGTVELFKRVTDSPVWYEQRHDILKRGIESYFEGDPIITIHILVTEIENAVRAIANNLGLTMQKKNRNGGFDLKNLGDFLADETIVAFLTEDVVTYLRTVLTDRRGWNLRNNTCHGILPATSFTQAASQQLLHIVLLLSSVRIRDNESGQTAG